jgi:sulfite exporter TauE/SafE
MVRQLLYSAGRLMTYGFCGALAGTIGRRMSQVESGWFNLQAFVAIVAGLLLLWQGIESAGFALFRRKSPAASESCPAGMLFKTFLTAPHLSGVFVAGLTTGFLPCGLVYAHLTLAGASGGMLSGLTTMLAFGAGTVPLMVMTGLGSRVLSLSMRRRLLQCAAWCVIVSGVICTTRGALAASQSFHSSSSERTACPFCRLRASP